MAVVLDEYGSAIGFLASGDILEKVVGGIDDVEFRLHHHHRHHIEDITDGVYFAEAQVTISDLYDQLNFSLPTRKVREDWIKRALAFWSRNVERMLKKVRMGAEKTDRSPKERHSSHK
jgi:CBS domain containing-hemolysin-like protein